MIQDVFNKMPTKDWYEFWCTTFDDDNEPAYESNICYYIVSTNCIWDGEEFITNVPADLAEYIVAHYTSTKRKKKTSYRIGIAYEITCIIERVFSRRAIIDRFLADNP